MGAVTAARRVAAIETAAMRLLPEPEPAELSPAWVCRWLSGNELDRLAFMVERAEAGEAIEDPELWTGFCRRALARALLNVDMAKVDEQERATEQLLSFRNPARPDDLTSTLYVTYYRDLVAPDVWHLDIAYRAQHPDLPATLSSAELQLHAPRPWLPRVAAGEVPP
jgi:hypothetical protein